MVVAKGVKLIALKGYKNPPVPRRLVGQSQIPPNMSPAYTDTGSSGRKVGQQGEIRSGPKQVFDLVGYQFDLKEGKVRPTLERWQTLTAKIQALLDGPYCFDCFWFHCAKNPLYKWEIKRY